MPLWRSQLTNVYHECQRCGVRMPLAKMTWQNGILVCSVDDCIDKEIIGQHELNVSREIAIYRHELEPDKKLTEPVERKNDATQVMY
jgi:hypothetical protein